MTTKNVISKEEIKKEEKVSTKNKILGNIRVTEKSASLSEKGVYTFMVSTEATKNEIKKSIKTLYNVTPIKVNIIQMKGRPVFLRGRLGKVVSEKKAVVYLKKGEKITASN